MLTLSHVIESLTGMPFAGGQQVITDVVIDSRLAIPGSLFVAIPGERTDGHLYVEAAFAKGAVAALIQKDVPNFYTLDLRKPITFEMAGGFKIPVCLRVADTVSALQAAAKFWRSRLNVRVVGVTGSVGKTTTKEIIAAVLSSRFRTLKSKGNFNNEIGLPISLLQATEAHERAVLEMGFYQIGEIALLCDIAKPQVGVVNNVYAVHLQRAGNIENIALGKGELVESLPHDGVAILNKDESLVMDMSRRAKCRIVTYGLDPQADVWASDVIGLGLEDSFSTALRQSARNAPHTFSDVGAALGAYRLARGCRRFSGRLNVARDHRRVTRNGSAISIATLCRNGTRQKFDRR